MTDLDTSTPLRRAFAALSSGLAVVAFTLTFGRTLALGVRCGMDRRTPDALTGSPEPLDDSNVAR
jgi:hypothetical protein